MNGFDDITYKFNLESYKSELHQPLKIIFCIFAAVLQGEIRSIQKARFRFIP